jgi:predicted nucleotidyltransferase
MAVRGASIVSTAAGAARNRDKQDVQQDIQIENRIRHELPHFSAEQRRHLATAVDRLVGALHPECVYLFGSHARGTARSDSDVDLLVVVPRADEPGHRRDQMAYAAVGWQQLPIELMVLTRDEFDRRLPARASLPATVVREGRLLYAASATDR